MKNFKGNIDKKITVRLIGDALDGFEKLQATVGAQKLKGVQSSKDITLLQAIQRTIDIIHINPFYGENAKKYLIPAVYKKKYDVSNIFIADLPDYWRLIYTLQSDEVEIIAFVLDIVDYKKYNKIFNFTL